MTHVVTAVPGELLEAHPAPCISVYMPTHRSFPENTQDPLRFRNLVDAAESDGIASVGKRVIGPLIKKLRALHDDHLFWSHMLDALAVFVSADYFRVFRLQQPVIEQVHVSDVFFIRPLIGIFQTSERYQLLALTRTEIHLYEGDRYLLDKVELAPEVPATMTAALGSEITPPHMTVASYGGVALGSSMRHGHSSRHDEEAIDDERFFRAVDHGIEHHHSNPSGLPLILAALPQHQALFRQVSHNPHLLDEGIEDDPRMLTEDSLRERAWKVLEPHWQSMVDQQVARYEEASSKNLGSDNPFTISEAALAGNVFILLLDRQKIYPGGIDMMSGSLNFAKDSRGREHDVLEDIAETVLRKGGEVLVLSSEQMPTSSGAAAIFRYTQEPARSL